MEDITLKYKGVKYFFDQMKSHRNDTEKFIYYLDAFLCSSLSLVEMMGKKNQTKRFRRYLDKLKSDELYMFFKEIRNKSVHHEVRIVSKNIKMELSENINISDSLSIDNKNVLNKHSKKIDSQRKTTERVSVDIKWYFKKFKDEKKKEVLELSGEFLERLEEIVKEYNAKE